MSQGKSGIAIAHRISTLMNCNYFVVLRPLVACSASEPQIEAACDSLPELYERSLMFRELAKHEGVSF